MSRNDNLPRRTSQRKNKGILPAKFESYEVEMNIQHSPKNTGTQQEHLQTQNPLIDYEEDLSQAIPENTATETIPRKSQSTTANKNELGEFRIEFIKQMEHVQHQMQLLQTQLFDNTRLLQSQIVNNTEQLRKEINESQQLPPGSLQPSQTPTPTFTIQNPTSPLPQNVLNSESSIVNNANQNFIRNIPKKIYPLPTFTGLPEEWQTFLEAFENTTKEFEYSNLHNIMRLREALKGKARETVESLLASSTNVDAIIKILSETFGRPEQLIKSQIEKVRAIPSLADGNLEALVNFSNKIANMSTFLQNVQGVHHLANPTLLSELVAKLPTNRQMQWAEKCLSLNRPATIIDFSNWLSTLRRLANMVHDTLPTNAYVTKHRQSTTSIPKNRKYACVGVSVKNICPVCQGECMSINNCKTFLLMSIDERWNKIKQLKVCFCCLKKGHQLNHCRSRKRCETNDCQKLHNSLLHNPTKDNPRVYNVAKNTSAPIKELSSENENNSVLTSNELTSELQNIQNGRNCHTVRSTEQVLFQILPVTLYSKNKSVSTYAFVDDGANVSIIDKKIATELELQGTPEFLELQWLNKQFTREHTQMVELFISGTEPDDRKYKMPNVYITSNLSLPVQSCQVEKFRNKCENINIANFKLSNYTNVQPTLVISLAHCFLTVPLEVPRMLSDTGPIIINTRLGVIAYGVIDSKKMVTPKAPMRVQMCSKLKSEKDLLSNLHNMMQTYFDVESLGTKYNNKKLLSKDNERALSILKESTRELNGRYECKLLWKENCSPLPDSYQMALNRLYSVERKMLRDHEYANEYRKKISHYIENGYARKLSDSEKMIKHKREFYLPHFGVKNVNKQGIRIVFDAAAEVNNMSLNKALLPGPDINNTLISIIFKFREAPIAICGDIKEMFHQIAIAKEDQHSQRFLWRNGDQSQPVETFVMERMIFGATCSPVIAQYVKNLNANKFLKDSPRAVKGIIERHYVDDYVDCFQSEDEAINILRDVIRIHKAGGFELRNIVSNSKMISESCGKAANTTNDSSEFLQQDNIDRILGIHWSSSHDVFCFQLKLHKINKDILNYKRIPTKREMLSLNMSVYDPFGFVADFMVTSKVLMQNVWKNGIEWDQELPAVIYDRWKIWLKELVKLEQFMVPRCYFCKFLNSKVDLHVFVDASEEAMATVAYWRIESIDGEIKVVFIMGKTSCAPTRFHSTPKLELQAAVMGVRMKDLIKQNHNKSFTRMFFWTDSRTVIQWIRSDHRMYKQYVANRVSEILESSNIDEWNWCPGEENPADEATRAKYSSDYKPNGRWINGPDFLLQDRSKWPVEKKMYGAQDNSYTEIRTKHINLTTRQVSAVVPDFKRFSKYSRLKRTTAWILRFIQNLLSARLGKTKLNGELTVVEELSAELYLCKHVQQQIFPNELNDLRHNGNVNAVSVLKSLNPFIGSDGLLRVSGRIENATCVSTDAKNPIILPKKHPFTKLLVESYHVQFLHMNTATVINEVRQRFWVPSLRQLLNTIRSHCQHCRIHRAKPQQPQMGLLPVDRVTPYVRPFSYTGLDYFGPINVTIRRRQEKRWIALFTCLSIRAIHLEIATDLSTDACLLCIRNFVNRRGTPIQIRSDNGTNFIGIEKETQGFKNLFDNDDITAGLTTLGIKWVFNTPKNPSEGGAWERLVQSAKKTLHAMLKEQSPRLDTLQSFLIEAENIINSRPLTHLPVTPEEPEPITPNHFLLGCTNSTQTPAAYEPRIMCLRKQWRIVQNLKNGMWRRWLQEYLPELTRRVKWCLPSQPLSIGSLVLICDIELARSKWKRGRVLELYYGKDGVARSAEISTSTGVYRRPVSKLAVLDVKTDDVEGEPTPHGSVHGGGDVINGNPIGKATLL